MRPGRTRLAATRPGECESGARRTASSADPRREAPCRGASEILGNHRAKTLGEPARASSGVAPRAARALALLALEPGSRRRAPARDHGHPVNEIGPRAASASATRPPADQPATPTRSTFIPSSTVARSSQRTRPSPTSRRRRRPASVPRAVDREESDASRPGWADGVEDARAGRAVADDDEPLLGARVTAAPTKPGRSLLVR